MNLDKNCSICNKSADSEFKRVEVWSNKNWRLTISTYKSVKGLCYLEPNRHIPYLTDLDGEEAIEFGPVIAKICKTLKEVFKAKLVYVYIFGGHIPHLHVHLAPHIDNDLFFANLVKDDSLVSEEIISSSEIKSLTNKIRFQLNY